MKLVSRFTPAFYNGTYPGFSAFDSLFDRVFGEDGWQAGKAATQKLLPVSIWQDDNNLYVEADLPGVDQKDLEIAVDSGVMTIKAERSAADGRAYLYNGRLFGSAERVVNLPADVDSGQVDAQLKNGILLITLPKVPEAKPRKIAVKTS
jgi:HSP20 family protein